MKLISVHNPYSGKDPQCRLICVVKGGAKVCLEPTWSQVASAQNDPHAKVVPSGGGGGVGSCPEPLPALVGIIAFLVIFTRGLALLLEVSNCKVVLTLREI